MSISLQDLKLFGQRVARLSLENDQLLGCLVGELILSNATSNWDALGIYSCVDLEGCQLGGALNERTVFSSSGRTC